MTVQQAAGATGWLDGVLPARANGRPQARSLRWRDGAAMALLVFGWIVGSVPAIGQEPERKLNGNEIIKTLTGRLVVGSDNGRRTEQLFLAGGATFYTAQGAQTQGLWEARDDRYCSRWPPGATWVCYDVLQQGQGLRFVSSSGRSYPVIVRP